MNTSQDYIIAIPTYNRPLIIINKTLKLLKEYDIPNDKIIIFVKDQEQMNLYKDIILNYNLVLTGASGIMETRNTIQSFFYYETTYTNVVYIDDDIDSLWDMDKKLEDLDSFITIRSTCRTKLQLMLSISVVHSSEKSLIEKNIRYSQMLGILKITKNLWIILLGTAVLLNLIGLGLKPNILE